MEEEGIGPTLKDINELLQVIPLVFNGLYLLSGKSRTMCSKLISDS
jgi:hypothetical protein